MKKVLYFSWLLVLSAIIFISCSKFDDSSLQSDISNLKDRVATLEGSMKQLSDYQSIKDKVNSGCVITSVTASDDGTSYTIKFSDNSSVSIKNGKDGNPGAPGEKGLTPSFKIENEEWYVSYDNGSTWATVGSAIDRSLISSVAVSGELLLLTLADGSTCSLAIGGENAFSVEMQEGLILMSSSLDTQWSQTMDIPYKVNGAKGNVTYMIQINSNNYCDIEQYKTDNSSGFLRIRRRFQTDIDDGKYLISEGCDIKFLIVNGDGKACIKDLAVPYESFCLMSGDMEWDAVRSDLIFCADADKSLELTCDWVIEPVPEDFDVDYGFNDLFKWSTSSHPWVQWKNATNTTLLNSVDRHTDSKGEKYYTFHKQWAITIPLAENNTGADRTVTDYWWRWTSSRGSVGTKFTVLQRHK